MTENKKDLENRIIVGDYCEVDHNERKAVKPQDLAGSGSYKQHKEPKIEDTAAGDVYYKTECKRPESKVSIPTYDAVVQAKEWVDDINRK